ncbi:hypothetical protein B0H67DRAFT_369818 [Lasiosphaeris hirsuta]|uniref:Uncharacterized protein n=1 Tax=Lasiosphaeris hirsuta TaxID=260670 RepID=A0AA40DMB0_9PEZI|nr:hypothetical protein B0H67DRAFT_369818 [Lasiosphaeris hirsuta]
MTSARALIGVNDYLCGPAILTNASRDTRGWKYINALRRPSPYLNRLDYTSVRSRICVEVLSWTLSTALQSPPLPSNSPTNILAHQSCISSILQPSLAVVAVSHYNLKLGSGRRVAWGDPPGQSSDKPPLPFSQQNHRSTVVPYDTHTQPETGSGRSYRRIFRPAQSRRSISSPWRLIMDKKQYVVGSWHVEYNESTCTHLRIRCAVLKGEKHGIYPTISLISSQMSLSPVPALLGMWSLPHMPAVWDLVVLTYLPTNRSRHRHPQDTQTHTRRHHGAIRQRGAQDTYFPFPTWVVSLQIIPSPLHCLEWSTSLTWSSLSYLDQTAALNQPHSQDKPLTELPYATQRPSYLIPIKISTFHCARLPTARVGSYLKFIRTRISHMALPNNAESQQSAMSRKPDQKCVRWCMSRLTLCKEHRANLETAYHPTGTITVDHTMRAASDGV